MYIYIYTYIYAYIHIYIYTYIHIIGIYAYIHMYIYTYIHICKWYQSTHSELLRQGGLYPSHPSPVPSSSHECSLPEQWNNYQSQPLSLESKGNPLKISVKSFQNLNDLLPVPSSCT